MSLHPQSLLPIPVETVRVAQSAFPQGNVSMQMRDALGSIYADDLFAPLYSAEGQPALHPWQLALVSSMQFAEH
jgi:transposase